MDDNVKTKPLLSIVVPTRNRVPYAISAIQSILEISDPRLELAVQDNGESRELQQWIWANVKDSRLQYSYCEKPLSFVDNFNAAVELTTGEYLCLIGDDDGVNPEIMEAAVWAKTEQLDALAVRTKLHYFWPGAGLPGTLFSKPRDGTLVLSVFNGTITSADMEEEMERFVDNGGTDYLGFNLPKLYHGLVRRQCLDAVKSKAGFYFGGLSPDIFASLSIACVARRVMITDYPLTIPGACGASASVKEGVLCQASNKLEDAPHFRHRGEYHWSELVPRVYCPKTIWADSAVAALRAMGRNDLVNRLNIPKMAAHCVMTNKANSRSILAEMFKCLRAMRQNLFIGAVRFGWDYAMLAVGSLVKIGQRIWVRLMILFGRKVTFRFDGLMDMLETTHALTRFLQETRRSFADSVRLYTNQQGIGEK